jgi:hypothetical protein
MFIFEKNPKNLQKPVEYTRFDGIKKNILCGERYIGESLAKQRKATAPLKGTVSRRTFE